MESEELEWFVVRSQPKRERVAAKNLRESLELEVVCPLVKFQKGTRRGKVWWVEAMFPGYLFARFNRNTQERAVRYTQGVLSLVQFGMHMPSISEKFIDSLKQELGDQEEVVIAHGVEIGEQFELADGPLRGEMGDVVEILPGKERVRLLVEFIGGSREVEVDLMSLLLPGRPGAKS
ncbi:transcription termination/antitermination protein NusG [Rubritalea tangerina]|uniref:Transcription termination/antitermination protein NusG n=1 Tax=Rubritalea tangerina TaxID=430798 RepID=A0ABW4ZAQ6_9BACT